MVTFGGSPTAPIQAAVLDAQNMELNVAGGDLLRSNHGTVVTEVNSSPSL